jgi:RNA polymerase sigma factor (sigma-70 family)
LTTARGYDALTDAALAALVRDGDGSALESLYDRHGPAAYALARHVAGDGALAADVVHEVFLAAWRDPAGHDPTSLLTAAHHRAVDAVRREERPRRTGPGAPEDAHGERVLTALAALPDDQRAALGLAYFGGYTQREVARLLDTPPEAVRALLRAALDALAARRRAT